MNVKNINITMKKIVIILLIAVALAKGKQNEAFLGIDLGITNSYIAVYKDGNVEIIPNYLGENRTPSYVAFKNGDRLVGEAAKNEALFNPENTIFEFNRIIGKNWQDPQFQNDIYLFSYKIVEKNNKPHISVNTGDAGELFAPEEVTAILLKNMKDMAEKYLGTNVTTAVITVPAYFNDDQRKYTKEAGRIAGWNDLRITDEPVAAAVAYGFHKKGGDTNVLVIHLGGETLEVSILNIHKGVIKIVASRKNMHFGGENFNEAVLHYYVKLCQEKGMELTYDKDADIYKLRREIEKAKHILSFEQEAKIEIKSFLQGQDLSETLTRAKFEELSSYLFVLTLEFVQTVLNEATIGTPDIDEIIFVGGSTQIPKLQHIVKMYFNKEPAVGVDPDKAVAYGAAIQGNIFYKKDNARNIIMANPYTLGIEAVGGVMFKLTPRFTSMPSKNSTIISTTSDNQETVTIKIYEGERFMAKHNKLLDEIKLTGVQKAVKGVPQIEVEFELDVDGILHVSAKYKGTEVKKCILIESAQDGLNLNDVTSLHKEVEQFAEEDERIKAREDTRIQFESYLLSVQRQVQQLDKVQRAIDDGVTWLKDNQEEKIEEYKKQQEAIETVVQTIMKKYETAHDKDEL